MVSTQPKIQQNLAVVTPWPTQDLVTLENLKLMLRIPDTDTSKDAELALIIDGVSATIAKMCNRVLGYDEVMETFYNTVDEDRVYFSQWPVKLTDIKILQLDGVDILPSIDVKPGSPNLDWILEEKTGTLFRPNSPWNGTLFAHYTGGYKLPQETPNDLMRAASAAMREDYYIYVRGAVLSGVRMIAHKAARVQYYPPGQVGATLAGTLGPGGNSATWNLIWTLTVNKYARWWV
jgi:hypothetical protein